MSYLPNRRICFKEESLPITNHNFHDQSLLRSKSKIDKDLNRKLQGQFFRERETKIANIPLIVYMGEFFRNCSFDFSQKCHK